MDAEQLLVAEAEVSAFVIGRGEDFKLIPLNEPTTDTQEAELKRAYDEGFLYCGVLGLKDGRPIVRIAEGNPGAIYTMMFAGFAFASQVAERMIRPTPKPMGDGAEWLSRLYTLPDNRMN